MKTWIIVMTLVFLANLAIDFSTHHTQKCISDPCRAQYALPLLLLHHLVTVFLLFGWLIPDRRWLSLVILGIVVMIGHWAFIGQCHITTVTNQVCNEQPRLSFRDVFWWSGVKEMYLYKRVSVFVVIALTSLVLAIVHYRRLGVTNK